MLLLIVPCFLLGSILAKPPPTVVLKTGFYYFTSPNYPSNYSNSYILEWDVRGPEGQYIAVRCDKFDLEDDHRCGYDFLQINGDKYCGKGPVPVIISTQLRFVFETDAKNTGTGFFCQIIVPGRGWVPWVYRGYQRGQHGAQNSSARKASNGYLTFDTFPGENFLLRFHPED